MKSLLRECMLELKVMGRSVRTIQWYQQKTYWYLSSGGVENLEQLNAIRLAWQDVKRQVLENPANLWLATWLDFPQALTFWRRFDVPGNVIGC